MGRFTISPRVQEILAVGVPILALVISLAGVYPSWGRYGGLKEQVRKERLELAKLKATPLPPRDPVQPAAEDLPSESAQFLGQIVALTLVPQCRFAGLDTAAMAPRVPGGRLKAVRTKVEVEGRYPQVRRFLTQVAGAPRLFVVTGLDLNMRRLSGRSDDRQVGSLRAVVDIERYIEIPEPPKPPAGSAPGEAPADGQPADSVKVSSSG